MSPKEWAEKLAESVYSWLTALEENLSLDLGDVDDKETD